MSTLSQHDPFVIHSDGEIVYANESCLWLFGSEAPDEVIGHSVLQFITKSYHHSLLDQFRQITSGQAAALGLRAELNPVYADSHEIVLMTSPVDWNGKQQLQTTIIDISDSYLEEPILERAMNAAPVGITIGDASSADEPLIYVSDEFVELTGYERSEALGQNCRFLQGEDTLQESIDRMRTAIEAEEPVTVVLRNYRKDGTLFWNRVTITPITDKTGTVTHFLGYQEDVSEMKMYEQEKTLFQKQAEAAPYAMLITDNEGTIEYVNPAFERMTGYTEAEALGKNPRILKSDEQDPQFYTDLWESITTGEIWEGELLNQKKSGELYQVHQTIVPILNNEGEITHFAAIERDISESVFTQQMLSVMNRILRHNLRTSINVIDGYAALLEDTIEDQEQLVAVEAINDRTKQLNKLSEKTADIRALFSKREEQRIADIDAIVSYVTWCQQEHTDAVINLTVNVSDAVAIKNGELLQLAIKESVENAIIHNNYGQPRIDITIAYSSDNSELVIDIADNGSGIPQEEWDVITANQETPLRHASGIGLWLIYWAITALGGTVDLTRYGSYGSVLTYRLPVLGT